MRSDEIQKDQFNNKPHVVILGAGASRAAFPKGDANGLILPLMNDFINVLNLSEFLGYLDLIQTPNFEILYSEMPIEKQKLLESKIYNYFSQMKLPSTATYYDHLLLSLRDKDEIFSFNWDPLLFDAFERNRNIVQLPKIFFLHGNVRLGYCLSDRIFGKRNEKCDRCSKVFLDIPLLFPIGNKDYTSNQYIKSSWDSARYFFSNAFVITIFGYGYPNSDKGAIEILEQSWFSAGKRIFEHVEIIDTIEQSTLVDRWKAFTPTLHLDMINSFEKSIIYRWPRRSCDALLEVMSKATIFENNSPPPTSNLGKLRKDILKIAKNEI